MLSVDEARARVLDSVEPLEPLDVLVADALGLVLADDLRAPHPLPRFDNSAMDGYALRAADATGASEDAPVVLEVVGEVRAGTAGDVDVRPGTAARIMTGAPLPRGADAVVALEQASERGGRVEVRAPAPPGRHVRPAGDDLPAGAPLVDAGVELGPGELALLASTGMSPLRARRGPRVAVLVTGDELVAPERAPGPGQIRDSNSVALRALVAEAGGEPIVLDAVPDDVDATRAAFRRAAEGSDLVVSSGGVAVGRYDFVKDVVGELGRVDLWRVAMQPGKPVVLGAIGTTPFLGLPGNPVSIHVCFEQFARPAIRKMRGCAQLLRPVIEATLTEPLEKTPGRLHFVRVRLSWEGGTWHATPTGPQGSHVQSSLVGCHGVARFDAAATSLAAGDRVVAEVWRLPGDALPTRSPS
ncbi:MAG TPA: gephyrin-like molybdotransferase Glp [Actinomycetota bacterium]|nr:gephyrin-like molybdotransferase Glp [Actinomycetota bacterium]